jgi:hypothetical protein
VTNGQPEQTQPTTEEQAQDVFAFLNSVPAAFLTEIAAATHRSVGEIATLLEAAPSRVVVINNSAPGRHVTSDLRIAALTTRGDERTAHDRIAGHWRGWVREFMAVHQCG